MSSNVFRQLTACKRLYAGAMHAKSRIPAEQSTLSTALAVEALMCWTIAGPRIDPIEARDKMERYGKKWE
jgi:hypothetical protein